MSSQGSCGVYIIECRENGATYVGKGQRVLDRVASHRSALARDRHDVPLLQADWNNYGADAFVIWIKFLPEGSDLRVAEKTTILLTNSLEHRGGYNRSLVLDRAISARIRDTERKLRRARKFELLSDTIEWARIDPVQVQTFCQDSTPLSEAPFRSSSYDEGNSPPLVTNPMFGFQALPAKSH